MRRRVRELLVGRLLLRDLVGGDEFLAAVERLRLRVAKLRERERWMGKGRSDST